MTTNSHAASKFTTAKFILWTSEQEKNLVKKVPVKTRVGRHYSWGIWTDEM